MSESTAGPLSGCTVGLLEARRSSEAARLVELQGGRAIVAPALVETPTTDVGSLDRWIDRLAAGELDVVIFLTGVGCAAILDRASERGRWDDVKRGLAAARVVARGPKPVRVLKEHEIRVDLVPPEPNTSTELLASLAGWELSGKRVGLQIYGGTTPFLELLRSGLQSTGASVVEAAPYVWEGPSDDRGVLDLVEACIGGRLDVLAIFSSSQIHTLFAVAEAHNRGAALTIALNAPRIIVAAVGPVAAEAIRSHSVKVDVEPEHPKMGHLIMALGPAIARSRGTRGAAE